MSRTTRVTLGLLAAAAIAVGGAFGLKALWNSAKKQFGTYNHCTIHGYDLDPEQAAVAATMVGEVAKFSPPVPERAGILVVAAALQESKLRNLPLGEGDRDSIGVLQQRLQYWGFVKHGPNSVADRQRRLNDVGEATREFLVKLIEDPAWQTKPLAEAVQQVQRSADGSLYAQHEPEATAIVTALDGSQPAAITCEFEAPTKVAAAERVAELARSDLPINTPLVGVDTVRVRGAHWQTAAWFIAYAYQLGIEQVSYDGHTWSRKHGWRTSTASSREVIATLYRRASRS